LIMIQIEKDELHTFLYVACEECSLSQSSLFYHSNQILHNMICTSFIFVIVYNKTICMFVLLK